MEKVYSKTGTLTKLGMTMKNVASILMLLVFTFPNVFASKIHGKHFSVPTPTLCEASAESSEEKCDNSNLSSKLTLKKDPFEMKFLLYKNPKNASEYKELFIYNKSSIIQANPFPMDKATWKILVHGFTNHKDSLFPTNVKEAYLEHLQNNPETPYNILVFDWGDGAQKDWTKLFSLKGVYQNVVENVPIAGAKLGDMIVYLHEEGFLEISKGVHLVGHSLGAHVSAHAARQVFNKTELLPWRISGLDPAGPLFWKNAFLFWLHGPYPRLHRRKGAYLDVYHTSSWYGSTSEMGDVDFYINGGNEQPACENTGIWIPFYSYEKSQTCSHQYATKLFAKSINNKTMIACFGCLTYKEYHDGECVCVEDEDRAVVGEYVTEDSLNGYASLSNLLKRFPLAVGEAFYDIKDDLNS